MRLRSRLLVFSVGLILAVGGVGLAAVAVVWKVVKPGMVWRLKEQARRDANVLAQDLDVPVATKDTSLLWAALSNVSSQPDFAGVTVLDEEGRVLLEDWRTASGPDLGRVFERPALQPVSFGGVYYAWQSVEVEGLRLGRVVTGIRSGPVTALEQWLSRFAVALGAALVLAVAFTWRFSGTFLEPIEAVIGFSQRVAGGALDARLNVTSQGELQSAVDALNAMADALESRDADLRESLDALSRARDEVEEAREAAVEASATKSQFLANMSHEIRTPLNGVMGMAHLALESDDPVATREYLEIITSSAESLLTIISDILDISKIEAKKLEVEDVPVDLSKVFDDLLPPLVAQAHARGLDLWATVAPSVPAWIRGDAVRIGQIITNLTANAVKFTEKGSVQIRLEMESDTELRFDVVDTGVGMSPSQMAIVFDAFTQADASTTRRFGGTGLGLAISRQLAGLMGGRLWAESEPGVGSAFHFVLPAAPATDVGRPFVGRRALLWMQDSHPNLASKLRRLGAQVQSVSTADALLDGAAQGCDLLVVSYRCVSADLGARLRAAAPGACRAVAAPPRTLEAGRDWSAWDFDRVLRQPLFLERLAKLMADSGPPLDRPRAVRGPRVESTLADAHRALNILVAEDNKVNRLLMQRILEREGHCPTLVENGAQALAAVRLQTFDLVLMDVQMPELDGLEATRAIRALAGPRGRTPVVALTAHAMASDQERCTQAGMDAYLTKPVRPQALAEVLRRYATAPSAA